MEIPILFLVYTPIETVKSVYMGVYTKNRVGIFMSVICEPVIDVTRKQIHTTRHIGMMFACAARLTAVIRFVSYVRVLDLKPHSS